MQETQDQATTPETAAEGHLIVEDVVSTLTGGEALPQNVEDLRAQMERAAAEFDRRTADAFGRALLDSLTDDPGNLRQLEALLILGLAHPDVLGRHRISIAVEGRRLAVLLERSGEIDRARSVLELLANHLPEERSIDHELAGILRRSGKTDELVERYLARAHQAVEAGKVSEAIPWLQEILLLDRTRRDVARMIRDLRYEEADREARTSRRNKILISLVLVSAVSTAVIGREVKLHKDYQKIGQVDPRRDETVVARKAAIEAFIEKNRFWAGLFDATKERDALSEQIGRNEREAASAEKRVVVQHERVTEMADAARVQALIYSERGDFHRALAEFQKSLSLAPEGWEHSERVRADIAALEDWKEASK
ncbi:MAG: hypothetical protein GY711_30235 [bacterium]|nr:hypothetical protein [bacterium]